jgi:hypothetical protein
MILRKKLNREVISQTEACHGKSMSAEIQPTSSEKCSEIVFEPFDDGRPEYEETFIEVQTL